MAGVEMIFGGSERGYIRKSTKEELYRKQRGKCMYCGIKLTIRYFHLDHKTPVARDGGNNIGNLQLLCVPCNGRKGDMTDGEFRRKYRLTPSRQVKGPPSRPLSQSRFDKITKENAEKRAKKRRDDWYW